MKIDYVVSYVDPSDKNWLKLYNEYKDEECNNELDNRSEHSKRFNKNNLFKYVFRSIEKYISWIDNVYLLVQSDSQVPDWIDKTKVKIVTHDQFIPSKYLPTFNSEVIECFLWNIKDLSEYFIYGNDDMYFTDYCSIDDFFTSDNLPRNTRKPPPYKGIYPYTEKNKYVTELVNKKFNVDFEYTYTEHCQTAFRKSFYKKVFDEYSNIADFSKFRTIRSLGQYLFSYYEQVRTNFKNLNNGITIHVSKYIDNIKFNKLLCINESTKDHESKWNIKLGSIMPIKSKYEIYTIPKVRSDSKYIHLIWLTDKKLPPKYFEFVCEAYKNKNPNWTIVRWVGSSEELIDLLKIKLYKELYKQQKKLNPVISKFTDIIRSAILYKYGGVYVDSDTYPVKPFNYLITKEGLRFCWHDESWKYLDCYFITCFGDKARLEIYNNNLSQLNHLEDNFYINKILLGFRPNFIESKNKVYWMKCNHSKLITDKIRNDFINCNPYIVSRSSYINHYFIGDRTSLR